MNSLSITFVLLVVGICGSAFCELSEYATGSTKFSLDLFQRVYQPTNNVVLSPISLHSSLAMFYPLAGDEVAPDLQKHLYLSAEKQTAADNVEGFITGVNNDQTGSLKVRSKVYHVDAPLNPAVLPLFRDRFGAEVETADFQQIDAVVDSVNSWVDRSTNGLIKKFMEPGDLRADDDLLLLNVVALNATWAVPFKQSETIPAKFYFTNGEQEVQLMHVDGEFLYAFLPQIKIHAVELLYQKESDLSMIVILPIRKYSLQQVVQEFSLDVYKQLDEQLEPTTMDVSIPKFTAKYKLDAKEVLKEMGLKSLFERFDLSILERDRSRIGEVRQTALIKVDEKGTVAVAATEVQATGRSANPNFYANRPFMYVIRKRSTKEIIFIGHYSAFEDQQDDNEEQQ